MIHHMTRTRSESFNEPAASGAAAPSTDVAWSLADLKSNPHTVPDKAQRVRRMFAAIARSYDLNNRLHSFGRDQSWRRRAVRLCEIRPSDHVLDVACGTGDLTEAFARARPASVTGLDFTQEMLEIAHVKAQRRLANRPGIPMPRYVQGDAMDLPLPDASVDVVSIAFGIRNVAEPERALREFRRVLRPGGRLVVLEFSRPRHRVISWLNDLYTARIMPLTATLIARDRSGAYRYLPQSVATFFQPAEFIALLERCGFKRVQTQPMTFGVCTAYLAHVPR